VNLPPLVVGRSSYGSTSSWAGRCWPCPRWQSACSPRSFARRSRRELAHEWAHW